MSMQRICDNCHKKIKESIYYTVHRHDIIRGDEIDDICCDCAKKLSVNYLDQVFEYKGEENL